MVLLFVSNVLGVRPGADGIRIRPRLPAGLARVTASLPVGPGWLHLQVRADQTAPPDTELVVTQAAGVTTLDLAVTPLP
jgi:cellobiose phosphorylase